MAGVTEFNDQKENSILHIRKMNSHEVDFERGKISDATYEGLVSTDKPDFSCSERPPDKVVQKLVHHGCGSHEIPSVEYVQDFVESLLIEEGLFVESSACVVND